MPPASPAGVQFEVPKRRARSFALYHDVDVRCILLCTFHDFNTANIDIMMAVACLIGSKLIVVVAPSVSVLRNIVIETTEERHDANFHVRSDEHVIPAANSLLLLAESTARQVLAHAGVRGGCGGIVSHDQYRGTVAHHAVSTLRNIGYQILLQKQRRDDITEKYCYKDSEGKA